MSNPNDLDGIALDFGNDYRMYFNPWRSAGVLCLRCTGPNAMEDSPEMERGSYLVTRDLVAVLVFMDAHEAIAHHREEPQ